MKIVNRVQSYPQATLIYSPPGVGKTEFAAHFPKCIFLMIDLEIGLKTLISQGRVPPDTAHKEDPVSSFDELMEDLEWLADREHPHETLVIDTLNSCQYLLKKHITREQFWNREDKFDAFAKGWERCLQPWNAMLHMLNRCRARGMRLVALAHSEVTMMKNPDGEDYQAHTPQINAKHLWVPTNAFFDNVLFMNLEVCSVTDKNQQAVKDKSHRLLYTQADAGHFAKNRFGLHHSISCGKNGRDAYTNFFNAIMKNRRPVTPPAAPEAPKEEPKQEQPAEEPHDPGIPRHTELPEDKPAEQSQPSPTGPEWVQTWLNRIKAANKQGPAISIIDQLIEDYNSAPEPDQVEHFPGLFMAWVEHCLGLKLKAQVEKRLTGKIDLPIKILDPLFSRLKQ